MTTKRLFLVILVLAALATGGTLVYERVQAQALAAGSPLDPEVVVAQSKQEPIRNRSVAGLYNCSTLISAHSPVPTSEGWVLRWQYNVPDDPVAEFRIYLEDTADDDDARQAWKAAGNSPELYEGKLIGEYASGKTLGSYFANEKLLQGWFPLLPKVNHKITVQANGKGQWSFQVQPPAGTVVITDRARELLEPDVYPMARSWYCRA